MTVSHPDGTVLTVTRAGPLVTVQDGGRPGLMRFGVPASGAMDRLAMAAANVAIGNSADAPCIEVSTGGLALQVEGAPITFALAGGDFGADLSGRRVAAWQASRLRAGDRLTLRPGRWGNWCYLAFAGELRLHEWLGSQSTHSQSGLGGGALQPGMSLRIDAPQSRPDREGAFPCPVLARARHLLQVVPGPQDRMFPPHAMTELLSARWTVSPAHDRMGLRLDGPPIPPHARLDMPSGPVLRGSIQVAGDGVPTVLMADHQSTGGYPRIATVIDADLDGLSRLRPREALGFQAITPEQAVARARTHAAACSAWLDRLARRRVDPAAGVSV